MKEESATYRIKELYKNFKEVRKKYGYPAELSNGAIAAIAENAFAQKEAQKENEAAEKQEEGSEQDRLGAQARRSGKALEATEGSAFNKFSPKSS